jgi:hypothetical protein
VLCHSGTARAASAALCRAISEPTGWPAAIRALMSAVNRSSCSVLGRSPCPGASMAATANPEPVTYRRARATIPGAFLCCPPPCPSRTNGRSAWAVSAGDQSTPVTSPRVNKRSATPSEIVSELKRIGFTAFREFLRALPGHLCQLDRTAVS